MSWRTSAKLLLIKTTAVSKSALYDVGKQQHTAERASLPYVEETIKLISKETGGSLTSCLSPQQTQLSKSERKPVEFLCLTITRPQRSTAMMDECLFSVFINGCTDSSVWKDSNPHL